MPSAVKSFIWPHLNNKADPSGIGFVRFPYLSIGLFWTFWLICALIVMYITIEGDRHEIFQKTP